MIKLVLIDFNILFELQDVPDSFVIETHWIFKGYLDLIDKNKLLLDIH